jgi:hypothetical protein
MGKVEKEAEGGKQQCLWELQEFLIDLKKEILE